MVYAASAALILLTAADGWFGTTLAGGMSFGLLWAANTLLPGTVNALVEPSGIIAAMMFLFDWRMGLITLTGLVLFFAVNAAMQRSEQTLSQRKFNADERLVSKVLEYVQGIAEVKNFDLTYDSATQVRGAALQ